MAAVQIMCARLGMVTGLGLAGVIRARYPREILWIACALLVVANVVNIAADLGGMANVTELMIAVNSLYWTPAYALLLVSLLFWASYRSIARMFKWLTLALFAYVAAAFLAQPDWPAVVHASLIPACRVIGRVLGDAGRYPGNDHLALPFLLAGSPGSRTGGRPGPVDR